MRIIISIVVQFLFFYILIVAQDNPLTYSPTGIRNNEAGFENSASINSECNEIISEYDGNLSLNYSFKFGMPGKNLPGELSIIYNANVDHRLFSTINNSVNNSSGLLVNSPEWIIGINGIALQVLNFQQFSYTSDIGSNVPLSGEAAPTLIPGYHYSNKIKHSQDLTPDIITILKSDGSTLQLFGQEGGVYVEKGLDAKGYAVVEGYMEGNDGASPRKMWYKPGDGLTYYFEEVFLSYGNNPIPGPHENVRAMYLRNLSNNDGDTLFFNYDQTTYSDNGDLSLGSKYGRNLLFNKITTNDTYSNLVFTGNISLLSIDYRGLFSWIPEFDITNELNGRFISAYVLNNTCRPVYEHSSQRQSSSAYCGSYYITAFIDNMGRRDDIIYYDTIIRQYQNENTSGIWFKFNMANYLPKYIQNNSKRKVEFEYQFPPNDMIYKYKLWNSENQPFNLFNYGLESNKETIKLQFRDNLTNFMLSKKIASNNYNSIQTPEYTDNYNYSWQNSPGGYQVEFGKIQGIQTKITRTAGSDTLNTTTKNYTYYTSDYQFSILMVPLSLTKLMEETQTNQAGMKKNGYQYEEGSYSGGFYGGDFHLLNETKTEAQNNVTKTITTSYDNEYYKFFPNSINYCNNQVLKSVHSFESPSNINRITTYTDLCIPNNPLADLKKFYYKYNLVSLDSIYNGNLIKESTKFEYYDTLDLMGKTKNKTIFPYTSRDNKTTYSYYTDIKYHGLIKSVLLNNGLVTNYYYPSYQLAHDQHLDFDYWTLTDSVKAFKVYQNMNETEEYVHFNYLQYMPFKTEVISNDTVSYYQKYNYDGSLNCQIDENKYYSEYKYDNLRRITNIILPGGFTEGERYKIEKTSTPVLEDEIMRSYSEVFKTKNFSEEDDSHMIINKCREYPPNVFDYTAYSVFPHSLKLGIIDSLKSADLDIQTLTGYWDDYYGSDSIYVRGVDSTYYGVCAHGDTITFHFSDNTQYKIDVKRIIKYYSEKGLSLYGFIFYSDIPSFYSNHYEFNISSPHFTMNKVDHHIDTLDRWSSVFYNYDDSGNKITITKKMNYDTINVSVNKKTLEYDAMGQLRKTIVNDDIKETNNYNYLGLKADGTDGENRKMFYKYDGFQRLKEKRFIADSIGAPSIKYDYNLVEDPDIYEETKITDENSNIITRYTDISNNLRYETKTIDNYNSLTTYYGYDGLNRLTSVTSPMKKTTNYSYDELGYLKEKTTPDNGTTKYKYDKYGNLRFKVNSGASANDKALYFNKYDQLNRVRIKGVMSSSPYSIDVLQPDIDYSLIDQAAFHFENEQVDTMKFLVINLYDKMQTNGVFNSLPLGYNSLAKNLKGKLVATAYRDDLGAPWSYKYYSYDYLGRVSVYWINDSKFNTWKKIENSYDNLNNLVKQNINAEFYYWYEYDTQGRLVKTKSNNYDSQPN